MLPIDAPTTLAGQPAWTGQRWAARRHGLWCLSRAQWAVLASGVLHGARAECEARRAEFCKASEHVHAGDYEVRAYP